MLSAATIRVLSTIVILDRTLDRLTAYSPARLFIGVFTLVALLLPILLLPTVGSTQEGATTPDKEGTQKIASIVNDEIISEYDLSQRLRLVMVSTGVRPTPESLPQLRKELLQNLIDEKLQVQEAAEYEIVASDTELEETVSYIAQQNNASIDEFRNVLERAGVNWRAYLNQIYAELVWDRLIRGRFMSRVVISDEEIDDVLRRLEANRGKPEYRLAEIFLAIDDSNESEAVRRTAERIVSDLNNGAKFQAVARQFSQSSSAASGGDLGWIQSGQLDPSLENVFSLMAPGQLSPPLRTVGGYVILLMIETRTLGKGDPNRDQLVLKQAMARFAEGDDGTAAEAALKVVRRKSTDCNALDQAVAADPTVTSLDFGDVVFGDLTEELKAILAGVEAGHKTPVEATDKDVRFLMVCSKVANEARMPSRRNIENRLMGQQVATMARGYIRDLRRDATIEYR